MLSCYFARDSKIVGAQCDPSPIACQDQLWFSGSWIGLWSRGPAFNSCYLELPFWNLLGKGFKLGRCHNEPLPVVFHDLLWLSPIKLFFIFYRARALHLPGSRLQPEHRERLEDDAAHAHSRWPASPGLGRGSSLHLPRLLRCLHHAFEVSWKTIGW